MNKAAPDPPPVPIWARDEAFPQAPPGWGWVDAKKRTHPCSSFDDLVTVLREDRDSTVCLVWTPAHPRLLVPEEVPSLEDAVLSSRKRWIEGDLDEASHRLRWTSFVFAGLFAYTFYGHYAAGLLPGLKATLNSTLIEISFLVFLIFGFIPWYQARKQKTELGKWSASAHAPLVRFGIWLERQNSPVTRYLLALIILVGIAQLLPGDGLKAAGLDKPAWRTGEIWRLLTAPFLHGNPVHFALNAAALLYLGKRLEVFARWPHIPLVFLFSAWIGGEASARFLPHALSVGASGGLMGWLGFLLVFETLHSKLVPRSARRRLAAAVLLTAVIGILGHRFIDNAAHAGGLAAGMLYAVIVFPKSSSAYRPKPHPVDRFAGILALLILTASALFAVWKISAA